MTFKAKTKDKRLQLVAGFVLPEVKTFVQKIAESEGRSESQIVRKLLEESPRVKAELRRNGKFGQLPKKSIASDGIRA